MARSSLFGKTKMISLTLLLSIVAFGTGVVGALLTYEAKPNTVAVQSSAPITEFKYQGEEGKNALEILKSKASVITKQYDFGELVTAINGTQGSGPKYWSFYVNGKLSDEGAGTYVTHDSDNIEWKLQEL